MSSWFNAAPGELPNDRDWDERWPAQLDPVPCVDCGQPVTEGGQTLWARLGAACQGCVQWRRERGLLDDARSLEQLRREAA